MNIFKKIFFYTLPFSILINSPTVHAQIQEWEESGCMIDGVPTLGCLEVVTGNILFLSNMFILLVIFIMFVIGSFKYLTSLGNAEKIEEAKGTFKWAIIGLVVYLSSYLILEIIDRLFLGNSGKIFELKIGDTP